MQITWDENKTHSESGETRLQFCRLNMEFFAASTILPSKQNRMMAIGVLGNNVIAVVFARLGREGLSVISMRTASQKERKIL
ncbi:MAG: BrnT family toxin [Phyllobacterium sp.]|uniref:BrnT family toxin n=1 Tax=Phyllobacterium sp. TaxID=1871046 RepID=UPI0030F01E50